MRVFPGFPKRLRHETGNLKRPFSCLYSSFFFFSPNTPILESDVCCNIVPLHGIQNDSFSRDRPPQIGIFSTLMERLLLCGVRLQEYNSSKFPWSGIFLNPDRKDGFFFTFLPPTRHFPPSDVLPCRPSVPDVRLFHRNTWRFFALELWPQLNPTECKATPLLHQPPDPSLPLCPRGLRKIFFDPGEGKLLKLGCRDATFFPLFTGFTAC